MNYKRILQILRLYCNSHRNTVVMFYYVRIVLLFKIPQMNNLPKVFIYKVQNHQVPLSSGVPQKLGKSQVICCNLAKGQNIWK